MVDLETIQKRIEQLDIAQQEINTIKTALDDALAEDDRYQQLDLQTREFAVQKKKIKDEIWAQPTYQDAMAKMKDIKEEMADLKEILNHELLEWRQTNNSDEIIGADGTTRKLKVNVRLQQQRVKSNY
ncbi:MAG TPA: hypothetical protein VGE59_03520 [Patescibacteria group bacterium]